MAADKNESLIPLLADLDRSIAAAGELGLAETVVLLKIVRLDLQTKIHGVGDDDLREFSLALERKLLARATSPSATRTRRRARGSGAVPGARLTPARRRWLAKL